MARFGGPFPFPFPFPAAGSSNTCSDTGSSSDSLGCLRRASPTVLAYNDGAVNRRPEAPFLLHVIDPPRYAARP